MIQNRQIIFSILLDIQIKYQNVLQYYSLAFRNILYKTTSLNISIHNQLIKNILQIGFLIIIEPNTQINMIRMINVQTCLKSFNHQHKKYIFLNKEIILLYLNLQQVLSSKTIFQLRLILCVMKLKKICEEKQTTQKHLRKVKNQSKYNETFSIQGEFLNAGIIKNILTTDTLQYIGNFKFKMEVQGISESQIPQNLESFSEDFETSKQGLFDSQLNLQILTLISKGLPIFIFQQKPEKEIQIKDNSSCEQKTSYLNDRILTYNRKAKSLEQLSKKFIEHFEGRGNNIIELDKITVQLGVQRRRIYDVINILESLNVVTKKGKNNYEWKGLCQAVRTINICCREGENYKIQNIKKEKSLQYLASGFLKLFINWKPAISLQQAAKQMMRQMDDASVKTKIRRLYDIINVFRSLGLVRKASLPSKKPGYEWAGTQYLEHLIMKKQFSDQNTGLNELNNEQEVQNPEQKTSSFLYLKNSMFSPFICPQLPKNNLDNFKLVNETNDLKECAEEENQKKLINQDFCLGSNQFPIFRKSTSAFTLVASVNKSHC